MRLIVHQPRIDKNSIIANYLHNDVLYEHRFTLPVSISDADGTIQRLVQWLALIHAGYLFSIDYMTEISTDFPIDASERNFFEKIFYKGMAEFRYVNAIPIATKTSVASNSTTTSVTAPSVSKKLSGRLLLNGGGKDGIVSSILLNDQKLPFDLFQVGTGASQTRVAEALSKDPIIFVRHMDERWHTGQYKGHRPTSAAIAICSLLTAYLLGKKDVIASNEASANEATLTIDGVSINHQYSKSYEFEQDLGTLLKSHDIHVRYFSLLRPIHELQIVKILALHPKFSTVFISCNHGFRKGYWCKNCAKCAFICLALTAISPKLADSVFDTQNPIAIPALHPFIEELIDPLAVKPLECVGTLEECQIAAKMILKSHLPIPLNLMMLFERTTQHISDDKIQDLVSELTEYHGIPHEEYPRVIEGMRTYLQ